MYDYKINNKMIIKKIKYNNKEIEEKDKKLIESKKDKIIEEKEKIIEEYKNKIKYQNIELDELTEHVKKNKNSIRIIYHNNKEYGLTDKFNVENKNQLEIQLNGILNITNMENMFYQCYNLISLPDIHLINTQNITNMSHMFYYCSSLSSLPDLSKWDTKNVTDMSSMFDSCPKLKNQPKFKNK